MAWMSEDQAATALGVSLKTVLRRVGNGSLPSMRHGSDLLVNVNVGDEGTCGESQEHDRQDAGPTPDRAGAAVDLGARSDAVEQDLPARSPEPIAAGIAVLGPLPRTPHEPKPVQEPRPSPIQPVAFPKMGLAAGTLSAGRSVSAQPMMLTTHAPRATGALRTSRWMEAAIWVLATLVLSGGVAGGWLLQQSQARLHDAEKRCTQAAASTEQVRLESIREVASLKAAAAEREARLTADLQSWQARATDLTAHVQAGEQHAAELGVALDEAASRLALLGSQRQELSQELTIAQAGLKGLELRTGLIGSIASLTDRLRENFQAVQAAAPRPAAWPVLSASNSSRETGIAEFRRLPTAPPCLAQEDMAVGLRRIVAK